MSMETYLGFPVCCTKSKADVLVRCSASPQRYTKLPSRRSANYQPNSWNYDSLQSLNSVYLNKSQAKGHETLKQNVKQMIYKETGAAKRLRLVDTLQRLGVAYHFEGEIKHVLSKISIEKSVFKEDVFSMALLFRLLRENGFPVSQDIMSGFMDDKITFKSCLKRDINGLLSLYEASYLAFEGENLLDEARIFSTKHLTKLKPTLDSYLKDKVAHTLELPLHWRAPRLEVRWYIDQYMRNENMNPLLLQLARADFNMVQTVHQGEIGAISRWWTVASLREMLPFGRDRLIECFFCATCIASEPHLGACREILTKIAALIVYLDDVYDIYGTLDELVLFTNAIGKWRLDAMEELPEYMRAIYATILNTSNETAENVIKQDGWNPLPLLKKAWHDLCKVFLREAKWYHGGSIPSLKDYLENGWISTSGPLLLLHAFTQLGDKEIVKSLAEQEKYPNLVHFCSLIFRLCNDSATHSAESARGDAPSSIVCYMQEHGVSEGKARSAMKDLIVETWKNINNDALSDTCFLPRSFVNASMNLARVMHCIYQGGDGFGAPDEGKKNMVKSLLFDPISVKGGGIDLGLGR